MWPEKGSGFEADPFSPAGSAEREWGLIQRLPSLRRNRRAMVLLFYIAVGFVGVLLIGSLLTALFQ